MGTDKGGNMAALVKDTEIKTRTYSDVKSRASEIYARWGLSLNDAINIFLVKSIDVGGLPFNMRFEGPDYEALAPIAYKVPLNSEGVAVLPADWDDGE